ncbi:hypothetical protein X956_03640 [Trueperella pyogenes TP8]|nr:hypothetical protein [Trueperella pyogenes]AJC70492.1 hypothetical protein X956_03640 [Trueperella pyogenes TP8]
MDVQADSKGHADPAPLGGQVREEFAEYAGEFLACRVDDVVGELHQEASPGVVAHRAAQGERAEKCEEAEVCTHSGGIGEGDEGGGEQGCAGGRLPCPA